MLHFPFPHACRCNNSSHFCNQRTSIRSPISLRVCAHPSPPGPLSRCPPLPPSRAWRWAAGWSWPCAATSAWPGRRRWWVCPRRLWPLSRVRAAHSGCRGLSAPPEPRRSITLPFCSVLSYCMSIGALIHIAVRPAHLHRPPSQRQAGGILRHRQRVRGGGQRRCQGA